MSAQRPHPLRVSAVVAALIMLAPFTLDTYLPSFPDIQAEFQASAQDMQHTLSFYLWAFGVMTLVYGPLSDAFGRRPVVLGALLFYILASAGCALAPDMGTLVLARIGQGLAAGAGMVIGRALVRDLYAGSEAQRVMANVMLFFSLAPAAAPVIGGWLHDAAGWRAVFWFLAGLGLGVWLLAYTRMPETLPPVARVGVAPRFVAASYLRALTAPRFMGLVLLLGVNFGGLFLYIASAPAIIYRHLGYGSGDFWRLFLPVVAGIVTGSQLAGRLSGRWRPGSEVWAGLALMGLASLFNLVQAQWPAPQTWAVVGPVALYAAGMSFAMPSLTLMALDCFPYQRGMASAVQSAFQLGANGLVAALLVTPLSRSLAGLAAGMSGLVLLSLMLWVGWLLGPGRRGTD